MIRPVDSVGGFMKYKAGGYRQGAGGPVYMAAVVEYLAAEILQFAGNVARDNKRKTISSRHIFLAVSFDDELAKLFDGIQISNDVLPSIHPSSSKFSKKSKNETSRDSDSIVY